MGFINVLQLTHADFMPLDGLSSYLQLCDEGEEMQRMLQPENMVELGGWQQLNWF